MFRSSWMCSWVSVHVTVRPSNIDVWIWARWIYLSVDLEEITLLIAIDSATWHHNQFGHNEIWGRFSNLYTVISCSQGLLQNPFTDLEILLPKNTGELAFWPKDSWQTYWSIIVMKFQTFCRPRECVWLVVPFCMLRGRSEICDWVLGLALVSCLTWSRQLHLWVWYSVKWDCRFVVRIRWGDR